MIMSRRSFIAKAALAAAAVFSAGASAGCAAGPEASIPSSDERPNGQNVKTPSPIPSSPGDTGVSAIPSGVVVTLNEMQFALELADNETAAAFAAMLPFQMEMSELHGNEKYAYLDSALPANASNPGTIEAGDVMLYGDNCLVVFYQSHATSYAYTRIGKIVDASGLATAVGSGNMSASFAFA